MNLGLKDKVAIVTGGSKGIGQAIALTLAEEGAKIAVVARGQTAIDQTCGLIRDAGGEALGMSADVTLETDATRTIAAVIAHWGRIDILINNAGGPPRFGALQELTPEDWMDSFRFNVMSCVNFTKAAEAALVASGSGRIVTVSSISGLQPGFFNPHYTTTKAATINLTKHFANIYAPKGILANVVCPGPVHSESWTQNVAQLARSRGLSIDEAGQLMEQQEAKKIPLGRVGEGNDVAAMVAFLASDKANWITGACFHVSGGKYATMA